MKEFRVNTGMNYPHPSGALDEKTRRPIEKRAEPGDVIPESDLPPSAIAGLVRDGHISPVTVDAPAEARAAPEAATGEAASPEADASPDEGPRSRRGR